MARRVVVVRSKRFRPSIPKTEPPPTDPDPAIEHALSDGKHVLVVLDSDGARLYRTLVGNGGSESLPPLIVYNRETHPDPADGHGPRPDALERKAKRDGGGGGGGDRGHSSGRTPGVGGGFPLTDAVLRGVVRGLRDARPEAVLVAARGKGKSDGARALMLHARRHAPDVADKVLHPVINLDAERGGRPMTEAQLLRAARAAYRVALKPRVPLSPSKVGHVHGRRVKHE